MTSHFRMRFGMAAVRKEFVTIEQLLTAMTIQVREDADGKPLRPIGAILADLVDMTQSQIDEVLREIAAGRG